ncbi:MAG: twin-arginine translocation signal domain-containing protein [Steroidobacteraceae bacterium]
MSGADLSEPGTPAPSESAGLVGTALDRRAFLGTVGVAVGAALAASVVSLASAGHAEPSGAPAAAAPAHRPFVASRADAAASPDELWDIDDMWGHWPRYAHPIPYARVEPSASVWERIDPVDRLLVI